VFDHSDRPSAIADDAKASMEPSTIAFPTAAVHAPLSAVRTGAVPLAVPEAAPDWVAVALRDAVDPVGKAEPVAMDDPDADDDAEDVVLLLVAASESPALAGGATAVLGSTRAPVPQGMGSFEPGWVALVGGTEAPLEEAMVNRVVHSLLGEPSVVNW